MRTPAYAYVPRYRSYRYFICGCLLRFANTGPGVALTCSWILGGVPLAICLKAVVDSYCRMRHLSGPACSLLGTAGIAAGLGIGSWIATLVTWILLKRYFAVKHKFPMCAESRCVSESNYGWIKQEIFGWEQGRIFRYFCACGDHYLRYRNRFFSLNKDLTIAPYKRLDDDGIWIDDCDPVPQELLATRRDVWALPR
jgi:hypothetical protein